jgi:hypothetical protein
MDTDKILKLFKKYAGDKIDLHELIVTPVSIEPSFKIKGAYNLYFDISNPNNVSYLTEIVLNEIDEEVSSFEGVVNKKLYTFLVPTIKKGLYFNKELKEKIQKVFDSVKIIKFTTGTPFITNGYKKYEINIKSIGFKTSHYDDDSFYIYNHVKPIKATKNGEEIDIEDAIFEYYEEFLPDKETYWESENLYSPIDAILNQYPLLNDRFGHIAGYYETKIIQ